MFCPVQCSDLLAKCRFQRTWHAYQFLLEARENYYRNVPDFKNYSQKTNSEQKFTHLADLPRAEVKEHPSLMLSIVNIHPHTK